VGRTSAQRTVRVHLNENRGYLEQRIGRRMEASRLNIDDHGQKTSKASRHEASRRETLRHQLGLVHSIFL
jgi:hypothetical protein